MTVQFTETLLVKHRSYPLENEPFEDYLELTGGAKRFVATNTANWRGYSGTWRLARQRLYCCDIYGTFENGQPASLRSFFPETSGEEFAYWHTGTLRVPRGDDCHSRPLSREEFYGPYGDQTVFTVLIEVDCGIVGPVVVRSNILREAWTLNETRYAQNLLKFWQDVGTGVSLD